MSAEEIYIDTIYEDDKYCVDLIDDQITIEDKDTRDEVTLPFGVFEKVASIFAKYKP